MEKSDNSYWTLLLLLGIINVLEGYKNITLEEFTNKR